MEIAYHVPVLLKQSIEALKIHPNGIYADLTFGGGGHTKEILTHLSEEGQLYSFDQDQDAWENAISIKKNNSNFYLIKNNFRYLEQEIKKLEIGKIDGILADLGVSSHQFDTAERGFSFRFEADLDMRMNQEQRLTAQDIVNEYSEKELHKIFGIYGEIKNAKTLAQTIVNNRKKKEIITIQDLKNVIESCIPKKETNKYLAQLFQALRIEVNDELKVIEEMLLQSVNVLKTGGRLVVISYHSLEDRLVKNFFQKGKFFGEVEKDFYGNEIKPLKIIEKLIIPSEEEIERNPRARSAKMRVAEKI
ncbi:MAG: 16S rRNA (cytosine(1402)-N(4))-methyltransferase RsmH [Raineya sp.]|jgi:16S rRNA (cytosine1402-N4)-methyltransferase|nr:16S rRNA (cytosine(1402)-N(4))-methyltransferase RsmH [Raineya sp.]